MHKENLKKLNKVRKNKTVVLCHGVFDLLHIGHITYFEQAKKRGDILVASVTTDNFVNKGPRRPVFTTKERIEFLKNIKIIDFVFESNNSTAEEIIKFVKPNFYCKGPDYKNKLNKDKNLKKEFIALKKVKGKFITVQHATKSSTKIINNFNLDLSNDDISKLVKKIRKNFSYKTIDQNLKKIRNLKPLVLGEIILDKYNFVDAVGRSGKDPMMVFKLKSEKMFLGGTGYIANLAASLTKIVNLVFHYGDKNSNLGFIKKNLSRNIKIKSLKKTNSPTIIKERCVDYYRNNKIIGFYNINEENLSNKEEKKLIQVIKSIKNSNNPIIIADYGHGEITPNIVKFLQKFHSRIYINTQLNSFNYGSHNLKKFKKVNTICINESELRYELRNNRSSIKELVNQYKKNISFNNLIVTQGKFGSNLFTRNGKIFHCPAFNLKPLDTIGSGDTLFTTISLYLSAGVDPELALIFASVAAGMSTQNIGNEFQLTYRSFEKNVKSLFYS